MLYGVGGIGKSTLANAFPGAKFIDLEDSAIDLNPDKIDQAIDSWEMLRACLASDEFNDSKAIVIDTVSRAEELARSWVVANVKTDKGNSVKNLVDFGWNKGYEHLVDAWRLLIADLERHYRAGRDIILIAHNHIGKTPNPAGDDYIRNEPRLYHSANASVRAITFEWCDHVLFLNYDIAVKADGKAVGVGTVTAYTREQATFMAKSRTLSPDPIIVKKGDASIWEKMRAPSNSSNEAPEL